MCGAGKAAAAGRRDAMRGPGSMSPRSSHLESQWNSRHHVTGSVTNHLVPKHRRAYFDHLPVVSRAQGGEFADIALANPVRIGDAVEHEEQIHRRYRQFPQYWRRHRWPNFLWTSSFWEPPPDSRPVSTDGVAGSLRQSTASPKSPAPMLGDGDLEEERTPSRAGSGTPRPDIDQMVKALELRGDSTGSRRQRGSLTGITGILSKTAMVGADDVDQELGKFMAWAKAQHGHLVRLWHKLDTDGSMLLHKGEFVQGLKRLHYTGNAERLWRSLDRDTTGNISFMEFAPEAALELARFKRWAVKTFGNMHELFQALDHDRSGAISYKEFLDACGRLGLPEEMHDTIVTLFLLLDYDSNDGKGSISAEEMSFLDVWKPPGYLWETPDYDAKDRFQEALVSKHNQNPLMAWRWALDRDASMRVSYEEFVIQCKTLAKKGMSEAAPPEGVTSLYVAFDEDRRGWITLRDWDPDAFENLERFVTFARTECGNLNRFLKAVEGVTGDEGEKVALGGGVPLGMFRRALKPGGFPPSKCFSLFEALQAPTKRRGHNTSYLFPSDISFLAHWDPDREMKEDSTWSLIVSQKMSLSAPGPGGRGGLKRLASLI